LLALDRLDGPRRRKTRACVYHDFEASYDVPSSVGANSITYPSGPCPSHIDDDSSRVHERKAEAVVQIGSGVAVAEVDTSPPHGRNAEATIESRDH
jgi:hypothetical protein